MPAQPLALFTTFEPSGDALAAGVIRALRAQCPELQVYAMGGPKMEAAGAVLLEQTTAHAAMGLDSLRQIKAHRQRIGRLAEWLRRNPLALLVPTDSPAGNWSICRQVRHIRPSASIVHLVAPQLWAWGSWRIGRLRRLTDHVLCLLPFEPSWFERRGVRATFVGHPVFDPQCHVMADAPGDLPATGHRLALLPGSRTGEIRRNWPTMLEIYRRLKPRHDDLVAVIAAFDPRLEAMIRQITDEQTGGRWPAGLHVAVGRTEGVLAWSDLVLVASGTATLQVAAYGKPMVAMYNVSRAAYHLIGRWIVCTHTYALPNLVSEWRNRGRAIPEFIPHFGDPAPVEREMEKLLVDPLAVRRQHEVLDDVVAQFAGKQFSAEAAGQLHAALAGKGHCRQ